jgi:hypothetical protein
MRELRGQDEGSEPRLSGDRNAGDPDCIPCYLLRHPAVSCAEVRQRADSIGSGAAVGVELDLPPPSPSPTHASPSRCVTRPPPSVTIAGMCARRTGHDLGACCARHSHQQDEASISKTKIYFRDMNSVGLLLEVFSVRHRHAWFGLIVGLNCCVSCNSTETGCLKSKIDPTWSELSAVVLRARPLGSNDVRWGNRVTMAVPLEVLVNKTDYVFEKDSVLPIADWDITRSFSECNILYLKKPVGGIWFIIAIE